MSVSLLVVGISGAFFVVAAREVLCAYGETIYLVWIVCVCVFVCVLGRRGGFTRGMEHGVGEAILMRGSA